MSVEVQEVVRAGQGWGGTLGLATKVMCFLGAL